MTAPCGTPLLATLLDLDDSQITRVGILWDSSFDISDISAQFSVPTGRGNITASAKLVNKTSVCARDGDRLLVLDGDRRLTQLCALRQFNKISGQWKTYGFHLHRESSSKEYNSIERNYLLAPLTNEQFNSAGKN